MNNYHFKFIDRLKGFAILLVVMGHIGLFPMHPADTGVFRIISSFHMALFMFLSGWVVSIQGRQINLRKKLARYLIPFIFFGTLFTLYVKDSFTVHNIIYSFNFILSESKYGYWYFWSLAVFYSSLLPIRLLKRNNWIGEVLIAGIIYIIFYVGWRRTGLLSNILCLEHAVCFYPFYILGVLSRKYKLVEWLINQNWIFTISLFLYIGLMALEPSSIQHNIHTIILRFIVPLCAIIVCIYLFANRESSDSKLERQLTILGKNTLSIYALHYFILYKINLQQTCKWFDEDNNTFSLFAFILFISIIVAYISIYIGYFIKTSNWIRKWVYSERIEIK